MCVSSRLRPITSPPGGGTTARPKRASSGPASRNEARISRQRSGSSSVFETPELSTRTSFGPVQVASAPRSTSSSTIISTSRMRGTFESTTSSEASTVAARIGRAPFLFPDARIVPESGRPPWMTNDCMRRALSYPCRGRDPRQRVGDADALHEERVAAPARARRRGVDALVRAALRRGRGALGLHGAAPRLRLRDPPHARQAPAGRRADPARGGLPGGR